MLRLASLMTASSRVTSESCSAATTELRACGRGATRWRSAITTVQRSSRDLTQRLDAGRGT